MLTPIEYLALSDKELSILNFMILIMIQMMGLFNLELKGSLHKIMQENNTTKDL